MLVANQGPVASDTALETGEDVPLKLMVSDLLALASDPDGGSIALGSVSGAIGGTVEIVDSTRVVFTPNEDYNGEASFTYTVADIDGATASGQVTVTVEERNDAPEIGTSLVDQSSPEDTGVSFTLPNDAFVDIDGDVLALSANLTSGQALPDWLTFDAATGTFTGQPPADENFDLQIVVSADDGEASVEQTFTLAITAVNDAPVLTGDVPVLEVNAGDTQSIVIPISLFTDPDGDIMVLSVTATNGAVLDDWMVFDLSLIHI